MFRLNFKASIVTASKNSAENYYTIGLADDRYDYKNYLLFQILIRLRRYEDAPHNGYTPSVGDVCYNGCKAMKITSELIVLKSKIVSSPRISVALKFPNALCSTVKKFSAICLASRDKFKCTSGI